MYRLFFTSLVLLVFHATSLAQNIAHGTPPAPYAIDITQPDGTKLSIMGRGDEFHNWTETEDGYTLLKNQQGVYEYAVQERGRLVNSGVRATSVKSRSLSQQRYLLGISKGLSPQVISPRTQSVKIHSDAHEKSTRRMPAMGEVKLLAILIEYPDLEHTYEKEDFLTLFNGPSSTPTFKSYFKENSHGKFDPSVDVVGWYQAKHNYDYYGEKNGRRVARELVTEAIRAANSDVDFTKYDNDGDGNVDGVIVIHSGQGAEEGGATDFVWSHKWSISSEFVDGLFVNDYTIQPEVRVKHNSLVRLGIFCHEFGHMLQLPDLYDTDESDDRHYGIGRWGLMGFGGWLGKEQYPAGMSAYSKEALGWAKVEDITEKGGSYSLKAANSSGEIYKIRTSNANEYFLLENRQQQGSDEYLRGKGLAIWHINTERTSRYPESIHVNSRRDYKGVDLEEADGNNDLDYKVNTGDEGDLFPGSSRKTVFDNESDPSSSLYEDKGKGVESEVAVTNIQLNGEVITFDYNKEEDQSGSSCEVAVTAQEGENTLPKGNYWYTFTLPKNGRLVIREADAQVYLTCDESTSLATSSGGQLTTSWLLKDQTVKIKFVNSQEKSLPLTWNLSVDDQKADPALKVESVSTKTYGDDSFDLKALYNGKGEASYTKMSGPIEVNGKQVSITGAGTAKIKVTVGETEEYTSDEQEINFQINKAKASIQSSSIADKTYGDDSFSVEATSSSNADVSLEVRKGNVEIDGSVLSIIGAGAVEIEATADETENYLGISKILTFQVKKANQTISFTEVENTVFNPSNKIALSAVSNQDLPITFAVKEGGVKLDEKNLIIEKAGKVVIEASQAGNSNIAPATSVQRTFEVTRAPQSITFTEIENKTMGDAPFVLEAYSNVGIPVKFRVVRGRATLNDSQVTITGSGEVTIEAYNDGNGNYLAAQERQSFVVAEPSKENQSITTVDLPDTVIIDDVVDLNITVSSSLEPDIEVEGKVERSGDKLTFSEAGEVTITISQSGNDQYNPAKSISHTFVVVKLLKTQVLTYRNPENRTFGDAPFALDVESTSNLAMFYEVRGPVRVSDGTVTILGAGEVTIQVYQKGNDEYVPSEKIELTFTINKARQNIDFIEINNKVVGDAPFRVEATSDTGLPLEFRLIRGNATLDDNQVTITGAGEVTIEAYNDGNENYQAAKQQQSFIVAEPGKDNQTITTTNLPDTVTIDDVVELNITVSSGLNPDIDLAGAVVLNNQTLEFTQAGEVILTITQPGNAEYNPARTITHTFVVVAPPVGEKPLGTDSQTIAFTAPEDRVFGDVPFSLGMESSSRLPISYEVEGPAEIEGGILTITGAGQVTVRAFQVGDEEYAPSDTVEVSFMVNKASQAITFEVVSTGDNTFQIQAESSSGLPVTIEISEGEGTIEGVIITVISPEITVVATQPGNENYTMAEPISREVSTEVITSLGEEVGEGNPTVYPNPSQGLFTVDIATGLIGVPYQVFDLRGVVVLQGKLMAEPTTVDLNSQRSGTYIMQLQLPTETKRYRLIKL